VPTSHEVPPTPDPGVLLRMVWQGFFSELQGGLSRVGESEVASQLEHVLVRSQILRGVPQHFSFMAYSVPRLTREQRANMKMGGRRTLELELLGGLIQVELDDFGRVNWLYVSELPALYDQLNTSLRRIAEGKV
jgi:hypothetical protein